MTKLRRFVVTLSVLLSFLAVPLSYADGPAPPPQCSLGSQTCGGR